MTQIDQQRAPNTGIDKAAADLDRRIEEFHRRFDARITQICDVADANKWHLKQRYILKEARPLGPPGGYTIPRPDEEPASLGSDPYHCYVPMAAEAEMKIAFASLLSYVPNAAIRLQQPSEATYVSTPTPDARFLKRDSHVFYDRSTYLDFVERKLLPIMQEPADEDRSIALAKDNLAQIVQEWKKDGYLQTLLDDIEASRKAQAEHTRRVPEPKDSHTKDAKTRNGGGLHVLY